MADNLLTWRLEHGIMDSHWPLHLAEPAESCVTESPVLSVHGLFGGAMVWRDGQGMITGRTLINHALCFLEGNSWVHSRIPY